MASQKLSNLILPGSEDVYEIDAVYFGGRTAAEWQASTMSFKGTATIDNKSTTTATLYLEHVSGLFYRVPSSVAPVVGDSYKIIFNDPVSDALLYASSTDNSKGNFQIAHGDMIIYTAEGLWVDIPSGNDENVGTVTSVDAGDGLGGGPITTSGTLSVDWGRVAKLQHSHQITGETAAPNASFAGTKANLTFDFTPEGSVAVTSKEVTSGGNYTPTGTISSHTVLKSVSVAAPTFTGTEGTISTSYTPDGNIVISSEANPNGNYTPAGTISTPIFTGTEATIAVSYDKATGVNSHSYTPEGELKNLAFEGTPANITVAYRKATGVNKFTHTPEGSVDASFKGTAATINSTVTVTGTNTAPTVTVDEVTLEHGVTVSRGTKTIDVSADVTIDKPNITVTPSTETFVKGIKTTAGTAPSMTASSWEHEYDGNSKKLKLVYIKAEFNPGTTPVANVEVDGTAAALTGVSAALAAAPKGHFETTSSIENFVTDVKVDNHSFTPTASATAPTWSQGVGTGTASYTPAGSVTAEFTGEAKEITPTLAYDDTATTSTTYIPAGSVTGEFKGTAATLAHTLSHTSTQTSTKHTPAGTITAPVFTGTKVLLDADFTGETANISTKYTPTGTINAPTVTPSTETITPVFTGKLAKFEASFTGNNGSSSIEYTPTGSVTVGTTTVTGNTITSDNADD